MACGAKKFDYVMSKRRFLVFLKSRDVGNRIVRSTMIQNEIFNVFRSWKYEFLRNCTRPARARSPQGPQRAQGRAQGRARSLQGPTRAQGPAGPDPHRAPLGPRAPQGRIPAGPHQGPGPHRARSPQGPTRAQGPAGPDPRRAPPEPRGGPRGGPDPRRAPLGPRAPQGPIPAGPHQGPGKGQGEGQGPRGGPGGVYNMRL